MTFPTRYCCSSLPAPQSFLSRPGKASDTQDFKQDSTCLFWLFCALHMSSKHTPSSLFVLNHLFTLNKVLFCPFYARLKRKSLNQMVTLVPWLRLTHSVSAAASHLLFIRKKRTRETQNAFALDMCSVPSSHDSTSCPPVLEQAGNSRALVRCWKCYMPFLWNVTFLCFFFFPALTRNRAVPLRRWHELSCKLSDL